MFHVQEVWDIRIVLDLFFGGMGAGAFLIGYYLYLKNKKDFALKTSLAGVVSLLIGLSILITHLGKPESAVWTLITPQIGSVMTWGIFFNIFFIIFGLAFSAPSLIQSLPWSRNEKQMRILGALASLFAFMVMSYTGALLASTSIPLWRCAATPLLFIMVSISSGAGLYMLLSYVYRHEVEHLITESALAMTIGVLIILASMIIIAPVAHVAYKQSTCIMLGETAYGASCIWAGTLYAVFSFLFIACIMAPIYVLYMMLKGKAQRYWVIIAGILLILQSLLVRYIIVYTGVVYLPW